MNDLSFYIIIIDNKRIITWKKPLLFFCYYVIIIDNDIKRGVFLRKILCFFIIVLFAIPMSAFAAQSDVDQAENTVDDIMDTYVGENKEIPGAAIAIVKDGEVILEKGYGLSDIDQQIEVDATETVFEAASISKVYTFSAVMQLVEEGKIDLAEDIREYLPKDYLNLEYPDEKITMLHLMNHTAGFEDKAEQLITFDPKEVIPLHEYVSKKHHQPKQVFRPGTVTAYSNFGASLAGYIIERVSGDDFATYMQENVLDQLDMKRATFASDYSQLSMITDHKSEGYAKTGDTFEKIEPSYVNDAPAGSLNMTVQDMTHFMLAHLDSIDYQLFEDQETLAKMHEQTHTYPNNAHGFWERKVNGQRILEHGGNSPGFTTQLTLVPEEEFGMVLLTNVANEMSGLRVDLADELIGKHEVPQEVSASRNDEQVTGTYRMARGMYTTFLKLMPIISNEDVTIKKHADGGITLKTVMDSEPLHYTETDDLLYERVDDTVTLMEKSGMDTSRVHFEVDENGEVISMTYGVISDFLPISFIERADVHLVMIGTSIFTIVTFAVVSFIQWVLRKRRNIVSQGFFPATGLLSGIGMLIIANIIMLFIRFMSDPFQKVGPLQIHLWLNWLLPVAILLSGYFMGKQWKEKTLSRNITRILFVAVSSVFALILWNFNLLY